jgi:hypothetical protein
MRCQDTNETGNVYRLNHDRVVEDHLVDNRTRVTIGDTQTNQGRK